MRKTFILIVVCFLLFNSTAAFADWGESFYIVGDLAVARPLGIAATVIGGAIFVACLPFALPSNSVKSTADALVREPFGFTFRRPLGEFKTDVSYVPSDEPGKKTKE